MGENGAEGYRLSEYVLLLLLLARSAGGAGTGRCSVLLLMLMIGSAERRGRVYRADDDRSTRRLVEWRTALNLLFIVQISKECVKF